MTWMKSERLILASQSPRRKELLALAGFDFEVIAADIDEELFPVDLPLRERPVYLAVEKAKKVHELLADPSALVLAADSLVFLNEEVFSKPVDRTDAIRILENLSGNTHTVITGICLMNNIAMQTESIETTVTFTELTSQEIEYYIDTYLPYDKAGAYGIQDWIGWCKVSNIEGSYSNIMGLPTETVYNMLKKMINPLTNTLQG